MTHRLFEGKDHASIYQQYRFTPPDEVKNIILQYLDKKKGQPHVLAVDLGCGTGQNSRLLAPYFQEVVGIDISECQLEEARAVPGYPNITYRWFRRLAHSSVSSPLDCGERLNHVYDEVGVDSRVTPVMLNLISNAKLLIDSIWVNSTISVKNLVGFIESWSMSQVYKKKDPQAAEDLLLHTQK
ncbi:hypothetical protein FQN60_009310, partial [Etheostoma spectabile]